jgi:hypothetical protein
MKILSMNQITFGESITTGRGREFYQDIILEGKDIGCLIERETSLLKPITERYQICAKESEVSIFDGFEHSEDEGFILGYFYKLEDFIDYYNSKL